ncbi:hypothetical protein L1987_82137 [Smallanthus sonchifolius]|uniref:Uncharacterized protein n=1 Tax=Smallanthus sonchifolius TaxID=185202 RepID=A0ACB8YRN0_9ASTR|nr:hypothetical protein L1987_82137 [Smallanthus sonchifolius]
MDYRVTHGGSGEYPPLDLPPSPVLETVTGGLSATPAVTKQKAPIVNEDGFTTVTRRKKVGPIKVQGRKQKTVRVKAATQQYEHVRPTSRQASADLSQKQMGKAPQVNQGANNHGVLKTPTVVPNVTKKVSSGFNFARAVQGDRGCKNQQPLSSKTAIPPKSKDIVTTNRFSVLDIPNSIKFNKLIDVQDDFESMVFQMNREHIEGVRVLPASVLSGPGLGGSLSTSPFLLGPGHSGKSYGISDEQKRAIADRLKSTGSISMDIVDQWCPGQWDFFDDHCTLMELDPDYCIEDVESDTENGTAQFFSAQMKPMGLRGGPWPTWENSMVSVGAVPDGGCRIHISQEDLKLSAQTHGGSGEYPPLDLPPSPVLETVTGGLSATPAVTKQKAPIVNEDGFTTVTRRKKVGPIKVQGRKQKTVRVKAATQQYEHVRPTSRQASADLSQKQMGKAPQVNQGANNHGVLKTPTVVPNATKKVSSGFNFARAVQGDRGGKNQQPLSSKTAIPPKSKDIVIANRFSVLDIPNSIKFNKLIDVQDDLYPPDQSVKDGMELDVTQPKDGQTEECQSNQKRVGDLFLGSESMDCQMNREHIEGVRVLPASVLSSLGLGGSLSTSPFILGPGHSGKSYGISEEQKRAIADRLKSTGSISMDIVDQWCPGQWDFFNNHCTLMGLDPDYCIEDVESDTENGTTQFFSAQMKVGMPKVPSSNQPPSTK